MDAFALLTGGAKFDRGRLKWEEQALHGQQRAAVAHALPEGLLPAPAAGQASRKKRRKQQHAPAAGAPHGAAGHAPDAGGAGISVFGGSRAGGSTPAPAPAPRGAGDVMAAAGMAGAVGGGDSTLPEVHTHDPNEEANAIRKALRIKVAGGGAPSPLRSWEELGPRYHVGPRLRAALAVAGWHDPTPIQRQAVPALLEGRELLAIAPTGSGKTLAFLLPVVAALRRAHNEGGAAWPDAPKALFLSPTHELAGQTARVLRKLLPGTKLRACLLNKATAAGSDFSKVDILVANPLRLRALAEAGRIDLSQLSHLVIDEADKLFDMGFTEQVDALLAAATRPDITRALFSATLPEKVEDLARTVLRDPLRVTVGERNTAAAVVAQRLQFVGREDGKLMSLRQLLAGGLTPPVLVFVSTKERAKLLHRELMYDGVRADHISADQSAAARAAAVDNFRAGRTWVLIATDLIGRGMDFVGVNTVVNYDFPKTAADYIHRVGRTGRAGRAGEAVTFFTEDDVGRLRSVAHLVRAAGGDVPEWMLALKKGARPPGARQRPAAASKRKRAALEGVTTQPEMLDRRPGAPKGGGGGGGKRQKRAPGDGEAADAAAGGGGGKAAKQRRKDGGGGDGGKGGGGGGGKGGGGGGQGAKRPPFQPRRKLGKGKDKQRGGAGGGGGGGAGGGSKKRPAGRPGAKRPGKKG